MRIACTSTRSTNGSRLAAFEGLSRVIQIGSFSKTISASLRSGYIAAKHEWVEGLADLKIATTFGGGRLAAEAIMIAVTSSGYRRLLEMVRTRLAASMHTAVKRLRTLGIEPWLVPHGGMFLWCRLPEGVSATDVASACLQRKVVHAPGNAFSQSLTASGFLRFNVAQLDDDRIFAVLKEALGRLSKRSIAPQK